MSLYPLPNLIELSDFNGNWEDYKKHLYTVFQNKILNKLSFLGKPISCRRYDEIDGLYRTFWHLITETTKPNQKDEERIPDMRRCERISWIPHIMNHAYDSQVLCWEYKRGNDTNITLWLKDQNYMIAFSKRKEYLLLLTAFEHSEHKKIRNLQEAKTHDDPRNS